MQKILLPLLLVFVSLTQLQAQLIVNAGPDRTVCANDTVMLGGSPTASGGTGPYTYLWTPSVGLNSTNFPYPTAQPSVTTTYTVIVTDNLGAVDSDQVTVTPTPQIVATAFATNNVSCFGGFDGAIQVAVTGGTPAYTFQWSNGMTTQNGFNLPAGPYYLTVTDANGCNTFTQAFVSQPSPITVNTTANNESSPGACDGSIIATVTGGIPPYNYNWSNSSNVQNITNLCIGTYNVTVVDGNGCTAGSTSTVAGSCVNNTLVFSVNAPDLSCANPTSTAVATVSGGTPPYNIDWSTGAIGSSILINSPGVYMAFVSDSNGCTRTAADTVASTAVYVSLVGAAQASCNGLNDGAIYINTTGGTPPYTYLWSNSSTNDSLLNVPAGTYTLTVTDATSCSATFSYFLNQINTNWSYYVYVSNTTANCANNGSAVAHVYGGTAPFTYNWSNGATSDTVTNLAPGIYYVTVTGADGCIRTGGTQIYTSCYNIIQGRIINDLNGNCQLDANEGPYAWRPLVVNGGANYYGYTNAQGYYTIYVLAGTYTVSPFLDDNCLSNCLDTTYTYTFAGLGDTVTGADFYLVPAPHNLSVVNSWSAFRPGFTQTIYVGYSNTGLTPANATVTFTYDADLTYVTHTGGGVHDIPNRTITWAIANLPVDTPNNYYAFDYSQTVSLLTPIGTPVGTNITNSSTITGTNTECDSTDNHYSTTNFVTNSYDPNEKEVSPAGNIFDETDSVLTYTIHFQNTGNDTAWFVILKDTLSQYLEPATVQTVASSHPVTEFKLEGEGRLTWVFNPIYLVDSATNEPASKGYVTFTVKKKSGLAIGTSIENTAHIYFDYNEPVVTNTVVNQVADPNSIYSVSSDAAVQVTAVPNPFTQQTQITVEGMNSAFNFKLFDVSGKLLQQLNSINQPRLTINRQNMSAGIYFYSITSEKQKAFGRLVVE